MQAAKRLDQRLHRRGTIRPSLSKTTVVWARRGR